MTQAHTPGPWEPWAEGGAVGRVVCEVERLFGKGITIRGPELPMLSTEGYEAESWANAHLIAAAPELLEALQKIADYGEADGSPFAMSAAKTARAAIAKATGSEAA